MTGGFPVCELLVIDTVNRVAIAATAVFLGAFLLFLVQPMLAKSILPWLGGSASVWTACLLFFQTALLLGYCYAHWLQTWLPPKAQPIVHLTLLAISLLFLPPAPQRLVWATAHPAPAILAMLLVAVGLPYLLLSSTTALVQAWERRAISPYPLFALSNLGALLALYAYPLAMEPLLTSHQQQQAWAATYVIYAILYALLALRAQPEMEAPEIARSEDVNWRSYLIWFALAMCGSTLLLAVTNHICQDVAVVPLLWVAPLSLYLLSFVVVFHRKQWYQPGLARLLVPLALAAMGLGIYYQKSLSLWITGLIFGLGLFACCWFCHGELARSTPHRGNLTVFYLILACGGAAGGLFVSVIAPQIFTGYLELPLALAACGVLMLMRLFQQFSYRIVLKYAALVTVAFLLASGIQAYTSNTKLQMRNFYGSLSISEMGAPRQGDAARLLRHGTIYHGIQFLDSARSREPTAYYGRESAIGRWLLRPALNRRVGVIGLGVGTMATYGRPGDWFTFYEINPLVDRLARQAFTFLRDTPARVDVVVEDGRTALENSPPQGFDLLVVDAFSGDAIPVHLITKEAFEIYYRHLKPAGVLAFHVTNQFVDVSGVLEELAHNFGKEAILIESPPDRKRYVFGAAWAFIGGQERLAAAFPESAAHRRAAIRRRLWTDDYSNLLEVLR